MMVLDMCVSVCYKSNPNANLSCSQIAGLLKVPMVDTLSVLKTRLKVWLFDNAHDKGEHKNALSYAAMGSDSWVLL